MRTVVVTRPKQQAQPWIDAMRKRGHTVLHVPLLRVVPAGDVPLIQQIWRHLEQYRWIMFVSINAVQYFFDQQPKLNKSWPKHIRVGSPGEGTSQALIKVGVPADLIDQPYKDQEKDTEFLWQNIKDREWEKTQVLLVRGTSPRPPRDWLMNQLRDAGALVQPLVVYERQLGIFIDDAQNWVSSSQAKSACWIISSIESIEALKGVDWSDATAIVIHPRIAEAVRQIGFGQVICIQPDLNSLIESVESVV